MPIAEFDDLKELGKGRGGPDLQEDIIDSQQSMGLESEERALAEERQLEQLDVLEGLRQMQTADPISWKVYRYGHEESKYNGYLGQLQTTSLTQEFLRKNFGGGQYRVRGTFSGGRYAAQRTVNIAGESILYIPKEINGASPVTPQNNAAPFNMSEFLTVQQNLDDKRRDADERRRREDDERAERRSKENRDFMLALGAVVAPIVTAVVTRVAPSTAPSTDVAALITALKPSGGESPLSSMKGMLEVMTLMKGIVAPETSGGSELAEIINAVTPIAGPALQAFANRPAAQPAPQRPRVVPRDPTQQPSKPAPVTIQATPIPTVAQRPVTAPPQVVPGEQPTVLQTSGPSQNSGVDLSAPSQPMTAQETSMFAQLKPQVDTLVQMARDNQDAVAVGEMFYDQFLSTTTDEMYDQLCDLFEDPKTIDRIALFNSGVKEFRSWFVTLQDTIVNKIKQEAAIAVTTNVTPIDAGAATE